MPKDISRASVRTEVQPALSPSGLRIEAHPTGMSIPHGDYRPKVSADNQLIAGAFATLAQVGSEIAREQIVKQRKEDIALGTQARLEAGDQADRTTDTMDKSEHFIKGYDLMSGKLGAAQATADLYSIYEQNPDAFPTQSQIQTMVSNRIQIDLQGVTSPEMREAYLEGMIPVEAELTAKNAKYQGMVAHTQQMDNFSAVVNQTFAVGADTKSAQDLATDKAAMRELGLMNGLTSQEINKVLVTNIGTLAIDTGRPELLDAFNIATQDTENPDQTVPGLSTSTTFGPAIAEYRQQAERAKTAFEQKNLESRQNAFFKAHDAEPNMALRDKMIDEGVESGLISAEKARELRIQNAKHKDTRDVSGAIHDLANAGDYVGIERMVADGTLKESEKNKILDSRASNLLTFYHEHLQDDPTGAQQSLRLMTNEIVGTGRKSDVLTRELNPSPDNAAAFINSIEMANALEAQGASGKAVVARHLTDDQQNMRTIYQNQLRNGADQATAYQLARSYGTADAVEQGRKMVPTKAANKVASTVEQELGSFDPGIFSFGYNMANTAAIQDEILSNVRVAIVNSGGAISPEDAIDTQIERFKNSHTAYRPEGSDVGVWLPVAGIDQGDLQEALDWYGAEVAAELGYAEGTGFYPEFQPGIGFVMHSADHKLATRSDGYPVVFRNVQDVVDAYNESKYPSPEEAFAAQAAGQAPYAGRTRGPQVSAEELAAKRNARQALQQRREDARRKVMEVADRNAQRSREAIAERFGPNEAKGTRKSRRGNRGRAPVQPEAPQPAAVSSAPPSADQTTAFIAKEENNKRLSYGGWNQEQERWLPHKSPEGGLDTLAYGHKLTQVEASKGTVNINGTEVDYKQGLTDDQANALLQQDTAKARAAVAGMVKVPLNENQRTALTSLIYNVGISSFSKSKALKALNAGDMEEFRKQAFSETEGWTKVNGKKNTTLVERRKREEELFFK